MDPHQPHAAAEPAPPAPDPDQAAARLAEVLNALSRGRRVRRKRGPAGTRANNNDATTIDRCLKASRFYHIAVEPLGSPISVIYDGMANEFAELAREQGGAAQPEPEETEERAQEKARNIKLFRKFRRLMYKFDELIPLFRDHNEVLQGFAEAVVEQASNLRSEDIHLLRSKGIHYILAPQADFRMVTFNPPLNPEGDRRNLGWRHPQTARMLVPRRLLEVFDQDPQGFMDDVLNGRRHVHGDQYPTFLYDLTIPYDPEDPSIGLCRSEVLVRAYRAILTGPSSAFDGTPEKSTKAPKATIYNFNAVTPESICYVIVMYRYSLSSSNNLNLTDGAFHLGNFHQTTAELFDPDHGPGQEWIDSLLQFFERKVPGVGSRRRTQTPHIPRMDDNDPHNDREAMRRAVARRRAQAEEQAALVNEPPDLNDNDYNNHDNDAVRVDDVVHDNPRPQPETRTHPLPSQRPPASQPRSQILNVGVSAVCPQPEHTSHRRHHATGDPGLSHRRHATGDPGPSCHRNATASHERAPPTPVQARHHRVLPGKQAEPHRGRRQAVSPDYRRSRHAKEKAPTHSNTDHHTVIQQTSRRRLHSPDSPAVISRFSKSARGARSSRHNYSQRSYPQDDSEEDEDEEHDNAHHGHSQDDSEEEHEEHDNSHHGHSQDDSEEEDEEHDNAHHADSHRNSHRDDSHHNVYDEQQQARHRIILQAAAAIAQANQENAPPPHAFVPTQDQSPRRLSESPTNRLSQVLVPTEDVVPYYSPRRPSPTPPPHMIEAMVLMQAAAIPNTPPGGYFPANKRKSLEPLSEVTPSPQPVSKSQGKRRARAERENIPPTRKSKRARKA